jgi:hypothetical protein
MIRHCIHTLFAQIQWLSGLPDLSAPDLFLWGHLKDGVYCTKPRTFEELKERITEEVQAIDEDL